MNLEEAIKNREDCLKYLEEIGPKASPDCLEAVRWSVKALKALRPASRERVEKVWRGEWITKHYVDGILEGTNFDECSKCGYQRVFENPELKTKYIFCPNCGAPMTDEAVEVMMERLKEVISE